MRVFVAGANGFVGRAVVPALLAAGHAVRAGLRRPPTSLEQATAGLAAAQVVRFDLDDEASLEPAVTGCDAVVYLVHGLDRPTFAEWELETATRFARACRLARVKRLVYLGGVVPTRRTFRGREPSSPSKHLKSRLQTGLALASASPHVLELRAGVIVGAGGASFRLLRDVAARSPLIVRAPWLTAEQQPIGLDDVTRALVRSVEIDVDGALDLPGPVTLTSEAFLRLVAELLGNRVVFVDRALDTRVILEGLTRITRANPAVVMHILEGADGADYVARDDGLYAHCPDLVRTPLRQAVRQALLDEERTLTTREVLFEGVVHRLARWRR